MPRKCLVVIAALVAVMALPVAADAQRQTNHTLRDANGRFAPINSVSGQTIYAGVITTRFGRFVGELRVRAQGNTATASGTIYNARGSMTVSWTNTIEPQQDGSIRFVGSGRFTDGTRRYRNANGRFTFEGSIASGDYVVVADFEGNVRY